MIEKPPTLTKSRYFQRLVNCHASERHETSGKDTALLWTQKRDLSRQHRGDRLSPSGRARSVGDDPWREPRQSALDPSAWRAGLYGDASFPALQCSAGEELHR